MKPKTTVDNRPMILSCFIWPVKLWWHQVIDRPLNSKSAVFNKGIWNVFKGVTPTGGHWHPILWSGESLLWKNLQKNLKKNITSLQIKSKNPILWDDCTQFVCDPPYTTSRSTSRHHKDIIKINKLPLIPKNVKEELLIKITNLTSLPKSEEAHKIGQGDISTKWKHVILDNVF